MVFPVVDGVSRRGLCICDDDDVSRRGWHALLWMVCPVADGGPMTCM